jgi:hypothetical protein
MRRLFNLLTALSLLLFVAACVLWLRSRAARCRPTIKGGFLRFVGDGEQLASPTAPA